MRLLTGILTCIYNTEQNLSMQQFSLQTTVNKSEQLHSYQPGRNLIQPFNFSTVRLVSRQRDPTERMQLQETLTCS